MQWLFWAAGYIDYCSNHNHSMLSTAAASGFVRLCVACLSCNIILNLYNIYIY